jgi:chorismate synthase
VRRLRLTTAGESHGPGLTAILEGIPAGLAVDFAALAREMKRRQHGHGRGRRMQIEDDRVEIRGGVRAGETIGSPIALWIENRDYPNWQRAMSADPSEIDPEFAELRRLKSPRPGHADFAGGAKYRRRDLRDVLERASARESAARVAAGTFARLLLAALGIDIRSGVRSLGPVGADDPIPDWAALAAVDDASPLRAVRRELEPAMVALVDEAKAKGDTLGGTVTVIARGVPPGLGSHVAWDAKLDGRIAQAMLSIPAVKGVELGDAARAARGFGSAAHDALETAPGGVRRATNRAGGLEGGVTNGEDLVVTIHKKPIATLRDGLPSIDLDSGRPHAAQYERSDVTALPAAGVIAEAMLALVVADAVLEKFGGDSMAELEAHVAAGRGLPSPWPGLAP